jgi:hypothetical protein
VTDKIQMDGSQPDEDAEVDNESDDEDNEEDDRNEGMKEETPDPTPLEPMVIELTPHIPDTGEDDSDGEAACSGDERSPPKRNLQDIVPTPSVALTSSNTAFSSLSQSMSPSQIIDPKSGQHLISAEIQL